LPTFNKEEEELKKGNNRGTQTLALRVLKGPHTDSQGRTWCDSIKIRWGGRGRAKCNGLEKIKKDSSPATCPEQRGREKWKCAPSIRRGK